MEIIVFGSKKMEFLTPDTIYLHVTKSCNLKCVYCYFDAGMPMPEELSTEEILTMVKDISSLKPRRLIFTGGEPLLKRDIFKFASAFKELDNNTLVCLTTNGILINKGNATRLVETFDEIRISIDGFHEVNDILRGKGTFEKVIKAFQLVLEAGGDPVAFITVTSFNAVHIKNFLHYLLQNRISHIHLSPLKLIGRAIDKAMLFNFEIAQKFVAEFWNETFGVKIQQTEHKEKEIVNCGVGKFLTINPDGTVYPCHTLIFPEFCIGNVRSHKLSTLLYGSNLIKKLKSLDFNKIMEHEESLKILCQKRTCLGICAQNQEFRGHLWNILNEKTKGGELRSI